MEWTRRRLVGTAGAAVAFAGCLDGDGADSGGSSDEENDGSEEQEPAESDGGRDDRDAAAVLEAAEPDDHTGEGTVDITVDPEGGGFSPETLEIDADTVIDWTWEGASTGLYPIDIPDECFWDEEVDEDSVDERTAGEAYDRLFWADGSYLYGSRDGDGEEFTGAFRVHGTENDPENGAGEGDDEDG